MRAELAAGDPLQRWWRPLYGLELTLECAALAIVTLRDLWGGDTTVLAAATQATALLLSYWGLRFAVLGVYVQGRSREKEATITGQLALSVIEQIVKAVRKRRGICFMDRNEVEHVARVSGKEAAQETLLGLGIDTTKPIETQRNFAHLR